MSKTFTSSLLTRRSRDLAESWHNRIRDATTYEANLVRRSLDSGTIKFTGEDKSESDDCR